MEFKSNETIASQITSYVKKEIFGGRYAPGQKILPIREFAAFCRVNPNTVAKVYAQLEEEGLIYTDSTLGKFVNPNPEVIARKRRVFLESQMKEFRAELKKCGVDEEEFILLAKQSKEDSNGKK
ncbi:MAG: GntR family transcriptional regulator [Clostridia bacterium]|nr:GntR family transcriptional regulator [Clostridia bacterium]